MPAAVPMTVGADKPPALFRSEMHDSWVLGRALLVSCALHLFVVFATLRLGIVPIVDFPRQLSVSLRPIPLPNVVPSSYRQDSNARDSASQKALEKSGHDFGRAEQITAKPEKLAFSEDELDALPAIAGDLEIEPPYGFADDVSGSVRLSLLIDYSGTVRWVGVGETSLDKPTLDHIVDSFKFARFSIPRAGGVPVVAIYRIEVKVGEANWHEM